MTAAAAPPRPGLRPERADRVPPLRQRVSDVNPRPRPTLSERLAGIIVELDAIGRATCPLCGAALERSRSGGACQGCGSRVS